MLLFIAVATFTACNNSGEQKTESATANSASKIETVKTAAHVKIDPVCEMEFDTSWTEYTVYKGDTVKFCSDVCKGVFLKNPDKYASKLK
ncbi:MAG: YHS domain-containing protein [Bacteroidetes bacterium]|nr:YHS domain-containing protein [Bacteroidota bacterium]